jgi:AraC-like DNA-binding protein
MSDFQTDQHRKLEALLMKAMALDFVIWKAINYKARKPWALLSVGAASPYYGGLPNYASKADLTDQAKQFEAELVNQIYWQGKSAPRSSTQERSETMESLYGDTVRGHISHEVRELADRLGVSERHVRRKLAGLLKAEKIPPAWLVGKQWRPPVDLAEQAIRAAESKTHVPHTHATADAYVDFLVQCRRESLKYKRELKLVTDELQFCEKWIQFVCPSHLAQHAFSDFAGNDEKARKRAFAALDDLAGKNSLKFCKLFAAIYETMCAGSTTPVTDARGLLGYKHAEQFRRTYSKRETSAALELAGKALANSNWLGEESLGKKNTKIFRTGSE